MDLSNSLNVAAMRGIAEAAERVQETRAYQQRNDAGHAPVDHGQSATSAKDRRVKAKEAVDPAAVPDRLHRHDGKGRRVNIVT